MKIGIFIVLVFLCMNLISATEINDIVPPNSDYYIYTVEDLKTVEYNSNIHANFTLMNFTLMNDIEITDEIWKPIGSSAKPFSGSFNGNNHTITFTKDTELLQSINANGSENNGYGLFGCVGTGKIRDLNLVLQGNLTSNGNYTGALVGIVSGTDNTGNSWDFTKLGLVNCTVSAENYSVSGLNNVGGLVGYAVNGTFENSSTDCSVIAKGNNAGGFAGAVSNGTFIDSSSSGSVESAKNAGGFIGMIRIGSISNVSAAGSVKSNESSGGLIGYVSDEIIVLNSIADGNVKPAGKFGNFIGSWNENYKPDVINCFYQGTEVDLEPVPITTDNSQNYLIAGVGLIFIFFVLIATVFYFKKKT